MSNIFGVFKLLNLVTVPQIRINGIHAVWHEINGMNAVWHSPGFQLSPTTFGL